MKVHLESVGLSVTTLKNSIPTARPVQGRIRISPEMDAATFVEEEGICFSAEPKSKRVMQGKNCSVWYNPEKNRYRICLSIDKSLSSCLLAECDFEECLAKVKSRICNGNDTPQ